MSRHTKLAVGDLVSVKEAVAAYYSGYGVTPFRVIQPGEIAVVAEVDVAKVRRTTPSPFDWFYCVDIIRTDHNRQSHYFWRFGVDPANIVLIAKGNKKIRGLIEQLTHEHHEEIAHSLLEKAEA